MRLASMLVTMLKRTGRGLGFRQLTVQALGNDPDEEQDVGDEVDSLDDRENAPQRVDHAQRRREQRGDHRHALCTRRDRVDLRDRVAAGELGGLVFQPQRHLAVRVGRGQEEGVG